MAKNSVPLESVTPEDVQENWLWEFTPSQDGRLWVKPVKTKKTDKFHSRLAACAVTFADGSIHPALVEGIDLEVPSFSTHNRTLHVWVQGHGWFHLAEYFASSEVKAKRGDEALARAMGRPLKDVFPISFDLRNRSKKESPVLVGAFEHQPAWGLSQKEVMALLVSELG